LPISDMIAASAAFPVLIGPYVLQTEGMHWTKDKHGAGPKILADPHYTLWDGGVYDNLGLDPLHTVSNGLDDEIDFLIVSNASASIGWQDRQGHKSLTNLRRLLDISMQQVDSLRSRELLSSVLKNGNGMYFKIGYTPDHIAEYLGIHNKIIRDIVGDSLTKEEAAKVRDYPTTLNSPTPRNYDLIFRHGYENAKGVFTILKQIFHLTYA